MDPDVLPALEAFPDVPLDKEGLPLLRQMAAEMVQLTDAAALGVVRSEITVPGTQSDHPSVRCLMYQPEDAKAGSGAYLHLHGGGYILGNPEGSDEHNAQLASLLGITVISVDYRLAPEHPVPAALEDSYAVLAWLHQNADELGIDPARVAVGGESAGGGLAAALALHARDLGEHSICYQVLTYPMVDSRTGSETQPAHPLNGEFVWTSERNQLGWAYYLGDAVPAAPYVPALAESFEGLPPAWICTAAFDLFRDENIEYAQRLHQAKVPTELIVYPGTFHGFQLAPDAVVTKRYIRDHAEALARGLQKRD